MDVGGQVGRSHKALKDDMLSTESITSRLEAITSSKKLLGIRASLLGASSY